MTRRAQYLQNALGTVFSEHLVTAQEVANDTETRLAELEDRDARRRARAEAAERELTETYPALGRN